MARENIHPLRNMIEPPPLPESTKKRTPETPPPLPPEAEEEAREEFFQNHTRDLFLKEQRQLIEDDKNRRKIEDAIAQSDKIEALKNTPENKKFRLLQLQAQIERAYGIKLNGFGNPESETDAKKLEKFGKILNGETTKGKGIFSRLFGISQKEILLAHSFKHEYDTYMQLVDDISEDKSAATEKPKKRGRPRKKQPDEYKDA